MPEGPEVETVRRTLEPKLVGHTLTSAWVSRLALRTKVRRADFAPVLDTKVVALGRHGKLMWVETETGAGFFVRLGMTGRVLIEDPATVRAPHTHVVLTLEDGRELRYIDVRRFGDVRPFTGSDERDLEISRLGPDPLSLDDGGHQQIVDALGQTQRRVKDALLDQALVAGVGNIYVPEALFAAGVDPRKRGNRISRSKRVAVVDAVKTALVDGVRNGGTTLRDYVDGDGRKGDHQNHLAVFQRAGEACPKCGASIVREVWGGRSAFFCRKCQR